MRFIFLMFLMLSIQLSNANTLIIGDSLADGIGKCYVENYGGDYKSVASSGLINRKFFNWNEYIYKTDLSKYSELVIVLGTNDFMSIKGYNTSSLNWELEYKRKINTFLTLIRIKNPNINIIWVLPSNLRNVNNNLKLMDVIEAINSLKYENNFKVIDIREKIGYTYNKYYKGKAIRTSDGIHYRRNLSCLIAKEIKEIE